jgi:acetyltransferase EpsM
VKSAVTEIVIIAAGGHAAEVYSYLADLNAAGTSMHLAGLIDEFRPAADWDSNRIIGGFDALSQLLAERNGGPLGFITAAGDNRIRRNLVAKATEIDSYRCLTAWTLKHPSALVGLRVTIGEGTLLAPGSIITTRTRIGRHCILNVKVSVSHDCDIGDFVNLNPGVTVGGKVNIGEGAYIGAGTTIIDHISIGAWSIIGAGAVVVRDIPANVTAVGVPARIIKYHEHNVK